MPMLATNDGLVYARNCDFGIRLEIQIHSFIQTRFCWNFLFGFNPILGLILVIPKNPNFVYYPITNGQQCSHLLHKKFAFWTQCNPHISRNAKIKHTRASVSKNSFTCMIGSLFFSK